MRSKKRNSWNHFYILLLILIFAASVYIRFHNLGVRSLWLDEAWVANSITKNVESELINSSLTAPLFFVFSIHFIVNLFGNNEFFLRLLPCLFGIGTLAIFYLVMRKLAGKTATLLSLLILSFSYNFVQYSQELKQYTAAMFFTILLVYFCERVVNLNHTRDWILLILLSIVGIGFDHSIFFIIPAVFLVLLISFPLRQYWKKLSVYGFVVFIVSVLFFFLHVRHQISQNIGAIQSYWLAYYPKFTSLSALMEWFLSSFKRIFDFFSLPYFPLSLIIIIAGMSLFYKHSQKRYLVYILSPLILVLGASFLRRYPFGGTRLMLFLAPLLYLSLGKGLDFVFTRLERSRLYIPLAMTFVLMGTSPVSNFVNMAKNPLRLEEMRPLLHELQTHVKPQDKIYVYYGAVEAFQYYYKTKYYNMADTESIIWGNPHRDDIQRYATDLEKYLRKNMRIWIIFCHYWEKERAYIIEYLNKQGKLQREISKTGAIAYLFKTDSNS